MNRLLRPTRGLVRALHLVMATGIVLGGGAAAGCGSVATTPVDPAPVPGDLTPFSSGSSVDKIDLLLMIDNSRSMADKQQILAFAGPDLLASLLNPRCLDNNGLPTAIQPSDALSTCPPGARRAITPITDIHVGIVTSSLGGHGADTCSVTADTQSCPGAQNPSNDDAGHLVTRSDACGGTAIPTYGGKGFLAWDPAQRLTPTGEAQAGSIAVSVTGVATTTTPGLLPTLKDLVVGVGQVGCGFSSQLESWYRFLVDPEPYQTISVLGGKATPQGTDTALLKQRADFLRPDSLLAIVMLTDSNDCSIEESGQFYYAAQQKSPTDPNKAFHLPRARKECATNPEDPCCKSCGQAAPSCPVDDACTASPTLTDAEDPINLRCFDQKRRFGIDFLYPIERYTKALREPTVPDRQGDLVRNPIFSDLDPTDTNTNVRDKGLVFLSGIVGVPWQDIARDPADLTKGFRNSEELRVVDANGKTTWDVILGDPANHVSPTDPHMIESVTPRPGIPGPTSAPGTDPINGHDRTTAGDDLQYACIFALPAPRDCSAPGANGCDCNAGSDDPLCDPTTPTTQVRAKAYPASRELATLKSVDSQGLVASICPVQLNDATREDYGYRQALRGILDRLMPTVDGQCLPRTLTPDAQGRVACTILEARNAGPVCTCDAKRARRAVPASDQAVLAQVQASSLAKSEDWNCYCELVQAGDPVDSTPQELAACVGDASAIPVIVGGKEDGTNANGWCYVDTSQSSSANPDIVKNCPTDQKRIIRFAGDTMTGNNSTLFITCAE
jgi:hypothetical protein